MYGHDDTSSRYSPLQQIDTRDVHALTRAWTYHMDPAGKFPTKAGPVSLGGGRHASEATPIMVDGVVYLPTPYHTVIALNAESGQLVWTHTLENGSPSTRGVAYWRGDGQAPPAIVFGSSDGRLWSLNAKTGQPNPAFGERGSIDLKAGEANGVEHPRLDLTSPPTIYKDLVITGAQTQESPGLGPSADTRAWDLRTGKLVWRFHSVPHTGELGNNTWAEKSWIARGGTNVWGLMSIDAQRGLVFLPFGSPSYDFYGADRAGKDLFGNSLVALNANNGKLVWYFQVVHHDLWDYDLESAPVLMDVKHHGRKIPAVALISKNGLLFIFDRRNGKPIYGVEERPVPSSTVPGEKSWPTQPFPLKPQPLGVHSFSPEDIASVTPEQKAFCTKLLATDGSMASGGPYTPYGTKLTVIFPGSMGVTNWPGMSYNPKLGYLFVNTASLGDVARLTHADGGADPLYQRTSPWGAYARFWNNDKFWPCQKPPWGVLWAINVNTGDVAWKIPFGQIKELEEKGVYGTGALNFGGSITTAGGLVFIAATNDEIFRAFDAATGKVLWSTKLETGSYTTPMTYRAKNGKQYVVLVATGGSFYDTTGGDSVIGFALP
jgi:quinoprotein glucose dehydrogenase